MRGIFLIGSLLALLIGAYVSMKGSSTIPNAAKDLFSRDLEMGNLNSMQDLPGVVKRDLEDKMKNRQKMLEDQLQE